MVGDYRAHNRKRAPRIEMEHLCQWGADESGREGTPQFTSGFSGGNQGWHAVVEGVNDGT